VIDRHRQDRRRIPAGLKWACTGFVLVLLPVYAMEYGLRNFLWFSNVALLVGLLGIWTQSRLLISTQAVSVSLLEFAWIAGFTSGLIRDGATIAGIAGYMFDPELPLLARSLSLYHLVLPWLLLWLVWRLGYDRRAWRAWTATGWVILLVAYFGPGERNVNWVYGLPPEIALPLPAMPPLAWLAFVMMFCALCWGLTHGLIMGAMRFLHRPVYPPSAGGGLRS